MIAYENIEVFNAARIGVSTVDCSMYLTCGIPCADCARGIINAGIRRIICEPNNEATEFKTRWYEHSVRSLIMFGEAGVRIDYYEK